MKIRNQITFQIFILVLLAAVVGISGMFIMRYHINEITDNYELIVDENVRDRLNMSELTNLMYMHQSVLFRHVLSSTEEEMTVLEAEEKLLQQQIRDKMDEIEPEINEKEEEQFYHLVYSDMLGYFNNVDVVIQMSSAGNAATANYYMTTTMAEYIDDFNNNMRNMDNYIAQQMLDTEKRMENSLFATHVSEIACIAGITIVMGFCIIVCVHITSRLERYKNELEKEVENKTRTLMEHSRKMLEIQDNTIIGMATLIESRDNFTGEHIKRTSRYVELLAREAQKNGYYSNVLKDSYIELLVKAAPMHDIGKIVVPDSILKKPGKLTAEEFDCMKTHCTEGKRIVFSVLGSIEEQEYIEIAAQVAEGHHEKWDGSGYPKGIKGTQIPICARIMAVADVFDALVSKRCYKSAMPVDEAFNIITESSGSHFDPELVKLFLGIRSDVEKVLVE